MRKLTVILRSGLNIRLDMPSPEPLRAAAKRIATNGLFLDYKRKEILPGFEGDWNYYPPSQIRLVKKNTLSASAIFLRWLRGRGGVM